MGDFREEEKTREDFRAHEFLIYFVDRPERNWWDWCFRTREGFRHCFVTQWCEWSQRWIMIDWRQSHTDFIILFDFEIEGLIREVSEMKGTVLKFAAPNDLDNSRALVTYCSNIISRVLGLGNSIVLTPYGLYRRLLNAGGTIVFSWRDITNE